MRKLICTVLLVALLPALSVPAQIAGATHFEKAGLEFDYPADWKLTDNSTPDVLIVNVTPQGGAAQLAVMAQLNAEMDCDFQAARKKASDTLLEKIAVKVQAPRPLQTSAVKTQVGATEIEGLQIHGVVNNRSVTSDVYSFRSKLHLVNLVYLRADDDAQAASGWDLLRNTMKFATPVFRATDLPATGAVKTEVLNGRALHLAKPDYPQTARMRRAFGTVTLNVVVDEAGKVISAEAISGDPLLYDNSVLAAKWSKFPPTKVCGEPVKVQGVVIYNFRLR